LLDCICIIYYRDRYL
jgi:hypothetical protein